MPLFVEVSVIFTLFAPVFLRRDHRRRTLFENEVDEVLGVVGFVSADMVSCNPLDQLCCGHNIVDLAPGDFQTDWVTQGVNDGVNLGRQTTTTAPDSLRVAPPLPPDACWCART